MEDKIPWDLFEVKYASQFPSGTDNVAKPLRMVLGSLIIQKRFRYTDRELVEQITENPYLQYFVGLPGYQDTPTFDASTLVLFCKRITADMLSEANEYRLAHKDDDQPNRRLPEMLQRKAAYRRRKAPTKAPPVIDATCAPANIRYPQNIFLLNEARGKLEHMIYRMCKSYGLQLPRHYRRKARKDYLSFAKSRKHTKKQIRTAIRKQLSDAHRNISFLEGYFSLGCMPDTRDIPIILTIFKLYEQQEYMYKNKVHSVPQRIVSIRQPWIRP